MTEMFPAILDGRIKGMFIMGENPMLSDAGLSHVREALETLEFLVVQDIFFTETAQLADVVFPAASFAEKDGTFTNTERRVQRVRKAVEPPGDAMADWQIISELAARDRPAARRTTSATRPPSATGTTSRAREIFEEIASVTPSLRRHHLRPAGARRPASGRARPSTTRARPICTRRSSCVAWAASTRSSSGRRPSCPIPSTRCT